MIGEQVIWCEDAAIKMARTPGPHGPGFERDLLIQALGYRSHDAVLERTTIEDYGQVSWQWRVLVDGICVALRRTKPVGGAA